MEPTVRFEVYRLCRDGGHGSGILRCVCVGV